MRVLLKLEFSFQVASLNTVAHQDTKVTLTKDEITSTMNTTSATNLTRRKDEDTTKSAAAAVMAVSATLESNTGDAATDPASAQLKELHSNAVRLVVEIRATLENAPSDSSSSSGSSGDYNTDIEDKLSSDINNLSRLVSSMQSTLANSRVPRHELWRMLAHFLMKITNIVAFSI